jgi:hypothetical protein
MHLQSVYRPSGYYGGAGKFGFHPEAHLTETSPLVTDQNRAKLFSEWCNYWDLEKTYLLEKSPPNIIRTRFLQAMFPDSYFIILMRHPLAVSYATRAWYRKYRIDWRRLSRIFEHWLICHELFQQDRPHLRNTMVVKYEQFVSEPNLWVNKLQSFLNLSHHPVQQKVLSNVNDKYFGRWRRDLGRFLPGFEARSMIRRFETRLRPFGYSMVDLNLCAPVDD